MEMFKRLVGLALVLALTLLALVSCGGTAGPDQATETENSAGGETAKPAESETAEPRIDPGLPKKTFKDQTFDVLHWLLDKGVGTAWIPWEEITAETIQGDVLNDAIYDRNRVIEEQYGVTVTNTYMQIGDVNTTIINSAASGLNEYEVAVQRGVQTAGLLNSEYLRPFESLPYVNLNQPWWSQDCLESLGMGDVHLFATSDLLVLDKSAVACVQYNHNVAEQFNEAIGNLYEDVDNMAWTFERFVSICDAVGTDLDDDGKRDGEGDLVAFYCGDDPVHFLFTGAGLKFMDRDSAGYFQYLFGTGDTIETMDIIYNDLMYADFFHNNVAGTAFSYDKFAADELLFRQSTVKGAALMRNMESSFGVLPIPMFSENQTRYYNEVSPHHDALMCIPATVTDSEFCGLILEALSYESHYTVYPQFHDVVITGHTPRDEESKRMLDLVFETRVYDAGLHFDMAGFAGICLRHTATHTAAFASLWAENEEKVNAKLEEFNNLIETLNN